MSGDDTTRGPSSDERRALVDAKKAELKAEVPNVEESAQGRAQRLGFWGEK